MAFDASPEKKLNSAQQRAVAFGSVYEKITKGESVEDSEELEESLDEEGLNKITDIAENAVLDQLDVSPEAVAEFEHSEAFRKLDELQSVLNEIRVKLEAGEDITNEDAEVVQVAYDAVETATVTETGLMNFNPDTYITEQFKEHPYLIPSQRSPVYLLQREYRRAMKEGATQDAEELAQQIKDHVDELVGNDKLIEEGISANLELRERRRGDLKLQDLDSEEFDEGPLILTEADRVYPPEQKVEAESMPTELYGMKLPTADNTSESEEQNQAEYVAPTRLERLVGLHGEEVGRDMYESEQVRANLRSEIEHHQADQESVVESLSSEEQLKNDLAEFAVGSLEPELRDESYSETDESAYATRKVVAPVSFTPERVTAKSADMQVESNTAVEKLREKEMIQRGVDTIEKQGADFFGKLFGTGPSPYEKCGDEIFTEFMGDAGAWKINTTLQKYGIDRNVYDQWYLLRDEIMDLVEDVEGKTFKEVIDEYVTKVSVII